MASPNRRAFLLGAASLPAIAALPVQVGSITSKGADVSYNTDWSQR